ncbi:MAG TPA: HAMP domain-containing sensor histidine kinase [Kofleriaceae bacterium]|jgi:signal transduction histidine kinase
MKDDRPDAAELARKVETLTCELAARDAFIAVVGHELRNSLAPLVLLADHFDALAASGAAYDPSALPPKVAMLVKNLRKFGTTIDRVTEVAHLREGKLTLHSSPTDLVAVVQEVARSMQRQADAGCAELIVDAPAPVVGTWDRARLVQIVGNLVSNAIRYGGGGAIDITVRPRANDALLSVRDRGPGLAPAELDAIFDRFEHRRPRTAGGFGVGLFVVKTIAAAMGGRATAENADGGGARFSLILPRG